MNEKQAISKFEQNIRDHTVRVLVAAATKSSLDEAIAFAMQKELLEKSKNIKGCGICGLSNHTDATCHNRFGNSSNKNNQKRMNNQNRINSTNLSIIPNLQIIHLKVNRKTKAIIRKTIIITIKKI